MVYSSGELGTAGPVSQPLQVPCWAGDLCTIGLRRSLAARPVELWLWHCRSGWKLCPQGEVAGTVSLIIRRECLCWSPPPAAGLSWSHWPRLVALQDTSECSPWSSAECSSPRHAAGPTAVGMGTVPSCFPRLHHHDGKAQQSPVCCSLLGAQQTVTRPVGKTAADSTPAPSHQSPGIKLRVEADQGNGVKPAADLVRCHPTDQAQHLPASKAREMAEAFLSPSPSAGAVRHRTRL